MKVKKITWAKFIEILNSGVIIQNDSGVVDTVINEDEDVVEFHFDIDGEDGVITLYESDNPTLVYTGNTLFFNDSEGDVDEISVFEQVKYNFESGDEEGELVKKKLDGSVDMWEN